MYYPFTDVTNEVQWVNRFVCCSTSGATKQTGGRFAVWQTHPPSRCLALLATRSLFQCVNRQIAGALHFKLMHSTVPSAVSPGLAERRIPNRARIRNRAIHERRPPTSKRSVCLRRLLRTHHVRAAASVCGLAKASAPNEARRSINVSRGVISFSTDSCVKYQIKRAACLFKWSFVVAGIRRGGGSGGGSATAGGGRPGWIFDATCGGNVNIALPGLQRVGGFTK